MSVEDIVVVTGASGGIGSATVAVFLEKGYTVVGIDKYSLAEARNENIIVDGHAGETHKNYHHIVADITNAADVAAAVTEAASFGRLRHAVTVAGAAHPDEVGVSRIEDIPTAAIAEAIALNLLGSFYFAHAVVPYLRETAKAGVDVNLIFTSSINGLEGIGLHPYSAAKAGLVSLARTLAVEEGPNGLRVNCVAPGTVITPRTQHEWSGHPGHFDAMNASTILGRTTTPQEIANTYLALVETLTSVTGQTIIVDAGQVARWR